MPISISSDIISKEQLLKAQDYITQNRVTWSFRSATHSFLPLPYIKELATYANIKAFSDQDMGLLTHNLPENSRDFFINKVFKLGQQCFVATLAAGGNMHFLWTLMNHYEDEKLPVKENFAVDDEFQAGLDAFVKSQSLVRAPVLRLGEYDQQVTSFGMLPFSSITACDDPIGNDVEFDRAHLTASDSATPGARYAGSTRFVMGTFVNQADAEKNVSWGRRQLGIVCEGEGRYFLCCY
ncbi:hypothetical protein HBH70_068880 [Parastagonospora nodorum]|nr:hypothetical protein HBH46_049500 [Parastagonospora nodorum]KAH4119766.1 hypothetical protein HBH47_124420 [Parastagonospora nodorum]KAH4258880.1 hypothetical protein HBI03_142640 [Parastagonospora nodorum]KAH4276299.1 hypothetical protein HBI04_106770 [Parastagonospora nodorum]KAH4309857.1 hypothetical protein HBI01_030350 [Parastagonospora nodorum]